MITKKFGTDFNSGGGALTLDPEEVREQNFGTGPFTRTHDSGWTISGEVREDYYEWVNDFKATHPVLGEVAGNFESEVTATSGEAFQDFWKNHEPHAWDYADI
jgi:hypothetical protein